MPTQLWMWGLVAVVAVVADVGLVYWRRRTRRALALSEPADAAPAAPARPSAPARPRLRAALHLSGLLALALLPVGLVFRDRWLVDPSAVASQPSAWCANPVACSSLFLVYLTLVLAGALVAVLAVAFAPSPLLSAFPLALGRPANPAAPVAPAAGRQRRWGLTLAAAAVVGLAVSAVAALAQRRLPGWDWALLLALYWLGWVMADLPRARITAALRRHGGWLLAFGLAHLALIAFIVRAHGERQFPWLALALLVAAGLWLLRYVRRVPAILWVVTLALLLFSLNLNAWWSSAIGDEYAFYSRAVSIAEVEGPALVGARLFDRNGVYGTHPYLSSVIQAVVVRLFGPTGAAWRFSSVYLAALSIGLFYYFLRHYASRRFALTAALLLAVSHYLMAFSKIGYNNLQALFALALLLACVAWAGRTRLPLAYVSAGLSVGLCFYVYPAALYAVPVGLLVLAAQAWPRTPADRRRWALLGGSALALLFPLLLQPDYWLLKVQGTLLYKPALVRSAAVLAAHLASNLAYAFGSFLFIPEETHLVVGSYVDPLTGVLVLLGLGLLLRQARASGFARLWLLTFGLMLVLVGATHDRPLPPTTRMFLLLPWFALAATVGLRWLWHTRVPLGLARLRFWPAAALLLAVVLGLNLYQAYPLSRARSVNLQSIETGVVRLAQLAQRQAPAGPPPIFTFITDQSWGIDGIQMIPDLYPVDARFTKIVIAEPTLPAETTAMLSDENAVIIFKPLLELGWQIALAPQLEALGKTQCPVVATNGEVRFYLWSSDRWSSLCMPPTPIGNWWSWWGW